MRDFDELWSAYEFGCDVESIPREEIAKAVWNEVNKEVLSLRKELQQETEARQRAEADAQAQADEAQRALRYWSDIGLNCAFRIRDSLRRIAARTCSLDSSLKPSETGNQDCPECRGTGRMKWPAQNFTVACLKCRPDEYANRRPTVEVDPRRVTFTFDNHSLAEITPEQRADMEEVVIADNRGVRTILIPRAGIGGSGMEVRR